MEQYLLTFLSIKDRYGYAADKEVSEPTNVCFGLCLHVALTGIAGTDLASVS